MPSPIAAPITGGGDLGHYARLIPALREMLSTLPEVKSYTTFKGGTVLKFDAEHYVAALLPPADEAEAELLIYLAENFDGSWQVPLIEYYGAVEAWHLTPPWAK